MDLTRKVTVPGHSSRTQVSIFKQFPQRDEAAMSNMDSELHEPGFSNSPAVEDAPQDVQPDVDPPVEPEPGFSNALAVTQPDAEPDADPDDSAADDGKPQPDAKPATKKTSARKKS